MLVKSCKGDQTRCWNIINAIVPIYWLPFKRLRFQVWSWRPKVLNSRRKGCICERDTKESAAKLQVLPLSSAGLWRSKGPGLDWLVSDWLFLRIQTNKKIQRPRPELIDFWLTFPLESKKNSDPQAQPRIDWFLIDFTIEKKDFFGIQTKIKIQRPRPGLIDVSKCRLKEPKRLENRLPEASGAQNTNSSKSIPGTCNINQAKM